MRADWAGRRVRVRRDISRCRCRARSAERCRWRCACIRGSAPRRVDSFSTTISYQPHLLVTLLVPALRHQVGVCVLSGMAFRANGIRRISDIRLEVDAPWRGLESSCCPGCLWAAPSRIADVFERRLNVFRREIVFPLRAPTALFRLAVAASPESRFLFSEPSARRS